ncbi:MAG: DNA-directed RNA polymerase I subunit RPA2 [Trizodia sp. TS-e1964]|nr:MAG: DNA-directed RNA polymerase I subunit RPA2 [Trizodia sp. TS-e1964]
MPKNRSNPAQPTITNWSTEFDTLRRQKLFQFPPKDHSAYPALHEAIRPHIDSFNSLLQDEGGLLEHALKDIGTRTFYDGDANEDGPRNALSLRIKQLFVEKAHIPATNKFSTKNRDIFPAECRERHATYRGKLRARVEYRVNNEEWREVTRELGQLPIMLRSNRCHLENFSPAQLVASKEESEEFGGYFIVNGIEKLIRMLIVSKRNYPMGIIRPSYQTRGPMYSKYGISIRSVRPDQTSQSNVLHYLNDGNVIFRFSWKKREYLVPVMMIIKALMETNDKEIFEGLVGIAGSAGPENTFLTDRVELLLRTYKIYGLNGKSQTRSFLGEKFRVVLDVSETISDKEVGVEFLRKIVLVHLGSNYPLSSRQENDKFKMLLFMIRKLYALVAGDCAVDNQDVVQNQEILLGGFLYGMLIKERLDEWLGAVRVIAKDQSKRSNKKFNSEEFMKEFPSKVLNRSNENIGKALEYFISTGNLVSPSGLDLQQTTGFTVVAEKINFYRFISHFRMVHRGSFFAQLKTTTVRKLLPESWGFLCPVHTPDGSPCGLLNHLSHKCHITTQTLDVSKLPQLLVDLGVRDFSSASISESIVVQLDGRILGWCSPKQSRIIADTLRYWKVEGTHQVPLELEIGYIPGSHGGQFPGVYISSLQARMIRPVKYLHLGERDFVGPFEQPFMSIACTEPEISPDDSHAEYDPTNILSIVANMTPFSDFNQSPRNMYQCQMGKQAMGTPGTSLRYRADNKAYLLQTGQTPIARSPLHNAYGLDNFPNGMNAVVAVISYTGYDMDDAMIINKSSHQRGFAHGTIYKTQKIDLQESTQRTRSKYVSKLFGCAPSDTIKPEWAEMLDLDGLPHVGAKVIEGDVICAYHSVTLDPVSKRYRARDGSTQVMKYKDSEVAYIEEVRLLGAETGDLPCQVASIKFRVPRSPVIGDKFSSRHGQKGVCSQKWPSIDMPFSESGIQPDVIINPHAFPSRMTIGMFVESLAGKSGSLHGLAQDSTPFKFDEESTALEYFGHQLKKAGYNYYGNEPMYSGITGQEFEADIYMGVVYYQRLRHMVNDKFQVRTTGPVAPLTGQPIKGRKRGGGIRVGEMERDSLLAHGAAYLLQDRLLNCSDYSRAWICKKCGSFLSTTPTISDLDGPNRGTGMVRCRRCARKPLADEGQSDLWYDGSGESWVGGTETTIVVVPGVLRYLDVELSAMGVQMKFEVKP